MSNKGRNASQGIKFTVAAVTLTFSFLVGARSNNGNALGTVGTAATADQSGGAMAASSSIKILSPKVGEKIGSSALTVKYQLSSSSASADSSPTYKLQLDSQDPVETIQTEYSFSGLKPGNHVLTIELVDANHTPIVGSQAQVSFTTVDQLPPATSQQTGELITPSLHKASLPLPADNSALPTAGGELPLLSMVGFGVLVGGVISAMRTRK